MKKLILNLLLLAIVIFVVVFSYLNYSTAVIEHTMGPSTGKQIGQAFAGATEKNYDLIILGSSKFYRGINPYYLDIPSYNFAHDNDAYNQMYYKLKYLLDNQNTPSSIILSVDYSPFSHTSDSRNRYFRKYFSPDYFDDFAGQSGLMPEKNAFSHDFNNMMALRFTMTFPRFIESAFMIIRGKSPANPPYLKNNGQYLKPGIPTPDLFIVRNFETLEMVEKYFQSILSVCKNHHIKVFLVMPPYLKEDLSIYPSEMIEYYADYFMGLEDGEGIYYLDFSRDTSFKTQDFTGLAHLNEQAADIFSGYLNDSIREILGN